VPVDAGRVGLRADEGVLVDYRPDRPVVESLSLGPDARLRSGTVLYAGSRIGARLNTGHNVVIREESDLGDDVSVWSNSVVDYGCRIGDRVKIHSGCYVAQFSVIEADAFLAPGVTFANDLYPGSQASAAAMGGPHIGAGAQLGVNVTVLPYVHIGAGAVIGAGSVVVQDVAAGVIAVGSPARVVREVPEQARVEDRLAEVLARRGGGGAR
jgi:acetyltransferase-like isoleucine patch superfamily enzyme